jgi:hypothetical protein
MAIVSVEILKTKFESGDYPRSTDYINLIDTLATLPKGGVEGPQGVVGPTGPTGAAGQDANVFIVNYLDGGQSIPNTDIIYISGLSNATSSAYTIDAGASVVSY